MSLPHSAMGWFLIVAIPGHSHFFILKDKKILGQVRYLIVSSPGLCHLSYFKQYFICKFTNIIQYIHVQMYYGT